jgi:hypothetical protein
LTILPLDHFATLPFFHFTIFPLNYLPFFLGADLSSEAVMAIEALFLLINSGPQSKATKLVLKVSFFLFWEGSQMWETAGFLLLIEFSTIFVL